MAALLNKIRSSIIGDRQLIDTPFGKKPLVYADYTASGRSLSFIEDYIRDAVLPYYANTHTEVSFTGAQTTQLREQAREVIRESVNGTADDLVIFCGPGSTAAINKLIDILNLRLPAELSKRYALEQSIPAGDRPVVFVGPYEHHSNELPWRESIADVVAISESDSGQIDLADLQTQLENYADRPLLIGSFSAASNVTGIKSDVSGITALLKQHGALSFWDYAAAAPYVGIDMNGAERLDAVFISPHKFIGGPGTPGLLIIKRQLLANTVPAIVGGGTVVFVTPEDHRYIDDLEHREEGGTPAIIESIRAGLVFKLQRDVGTEFIEQREHQLYAKAAQRFSQCDNLEILGNTDIPRLTIMSLRFRHGNYDLHHGFVTALFSDLFGIQMRGGCSCAGPYGHTLLGIDMEHSKAIQVEVESGAEILKPGWVRLNFNYFIDDNEFEYLLRAVELVAEHGWKLLPAYAYDKSKQAWIYRGWQQQLPSSLTTLDFTTLTDSAPTCERDIDLARQLELAEQALTSPPIYQAPDQIPLSKSSEALRWFLLPAEAVSELGQETVAANASSRNGWNRLRGWLSAS